MSRLVLSMILSLRMMSCSDELIEQEPSTDYFIIGVTFGECMDDSAHLFKLQNNTLYADTESGFWVGQGLPKFSSSILKNPTALREI